MHLDWLVWNAIVPVLGPIIAGAIFLYFYWTTKREARSFSSYLQSGRLVRPSGWLYFSMTTAAFSFFTVETVAPGHPILWWSNFALMFLCILYHSAAVAASAESSQDLAYQPTARLTGLSLFLTLVCIIVAYLTYDQFILG